MADAQAREHSSAVGPAPAHTVPRVPQGRYQLHTRPDAAVRGAGGGGVGGGGGERWMDSKGRGRGGDAQRWGPRGDPGLDRWGPSGAPEDGGGGLRPARGEKWGGADGERAGGRSAGLRELVHGLSAGAAFRVRRRCLGLLA